MVAIEEIEDSSSSPTPSQERFWDAEDIEKIIPQLKRPTSKLRLESLVQKIRKEAGALKALESTTESSTPSEAKTKPSSNQSATPVPTTTAKPISVGTSVSSPPQTTYNSIDRFAFDAGSSSDKFVTIYLPLPGVGSISKDQISCDFGKDAFDITIRDLEGKNYRLKVNNLEHDIEPAKSKYIVKADKIVVKLHKVKGEYGGFGFWNKLTDPKKSEKKKKSDPSGDLMGMMKDLYDSGDDSMRKIIGETMMKQRNGELNKPGGGLDDLPDFGGV